MLTGISATQPTTVLFAFPSFAPDSFGNESGWLRELNRLNQNSNGITYTLGANFLAVARFIGQPGIDALRMGLATLTPELDRTVPLLRAWLSSGTTEGAQVRLAVGPDLILADPPVAWVAGKDSAALIRRERLETELVSALAVETQHRSVLMTANDGAGRTVAMMRAMRKRMC
jgi:hypothetical protein